MRMALYFVILLFPMVFRGQSVEEFELLKVYVEPAQIAIETHGIFVFVNGEWLPAESVCTDAYGLYASYHNPHHSRWICPRKGCKYNNNSWDDYCQNMLPNGQICGYPRPD